MGIAGHDIQFYWVCDFCILPELNLIYPCSCHTTDTAVVAVTGEMEEQGTTGSRKCNSIFMFPFLEALVLGMFFLYFQWLGSEVSR